MSRGSAPTVLARMSLVNTSHSLSRFGYCCWELLLRGTLPPALTALPPIDLEQPVSTNSVASTTAAPARTVLLPREPGRIGAIIWCSQSTDGPVPLLCRKAAGTAFD